MVAAGLTQAHAGPTRIVALLLDSSPRRVVLLCVALYMARVKVLIGSPSFSRALEVGAAGAWHSHVGLPA